MTIDKIISDIREAMAGATPGPWGILEERKQPLRLHVIGPSEVVDGLDGICEAERMNDRQFREDAANMRFIAAANPKALSALLSHVSDLERRLAVAEEALKPFANAAASYDPDEGDGADPAWAHDFPIGSLRRARTALSSIRGEEA